MLYAIKGTTYEHANCLSAIPNPDFFSFSFVVLWVWIPVLHPKMMMTMPFMVVPMTMVVSPPLILWRKKDLEFMSELSVNMYYSGQ